MKLKLQAVALIMTLAIGCGYEPAEFESEPSAPQPEDTAPQPEDAAPQPEDAAAQPEHTAAQPEDAAAQPEDVAPVQQKPDLVREKAKPGVGAKGRVVRTELISIPAHAYFLTSQRIVFNIQIPHAMNLYKAQHGSFPKTEEEFMTHIIKANRIKLPGLLDGQRYVYDAEKAQLMVERPR